MAKSESKLEYTPGPWQVDDGDSDLFGVFDANGAAICYLTDLTVHVGPDGPAHVSTGPTGHPDAANARLIAAAPQLREALEALVPRLERWLHYGIQGGMGGRDADFAAIKERAEAALRAAEGGSDAGKE